MSNPRSSGRWIIGEAKVEIRNRERPCRLADLRDGGEIHNLEQGIGRRLDPDHPGFGRDGRRERIEVCRVHEGNGKPRGALSHALKQAPGAAVKIVAGNDVASLVEKLEQRGLGRHPRREGKARNAALQLGNRLLEGRARGISGPGIFPACMHAGRGLREGCRGIDRRHHRAGAGVGILPAWTASVAGLAFCERFDKSVQLSAQVVEEVDAGNEAKEVLAIDDNGDHSPVEEGKEVLRRGIGRDGFDLGGHGLLDRELEIQRPLRERDKQVGLVQKAHAAVAIEDGHL